MKKYVYLLYYFFVIMYLELLLRLGIGLTSSWGLFLITTFSLVYGLLIHLVERLLPERFRRSFFIIITVVACLIFGSQYVYYRIFQTFFTVYSMSKSGQIVEFVPDILYVIRTNLANILLFIVPVIVAVVVKPKQNWHKLSHRLTLLIVFVTMIFNYTFLNVMREATNNPKNVYFHNRELVNGIRQLGLLTTMRLDLQRMANIKLDTPKPPAGPVFQAEAADYNQLNLTFPDEPDFAELNEFFSTRPATKKNDFTGRLKGYNVITITAESFSPYAINPELTPTLYRLANEGVQFDQFYTPLWGVSTIDGEYANLTGLLPVAGQWALYETADQAMPFAPGQMFRKQDYATYSFHNHNYEYYGRDRIHPNLGYDYYGKGKGLIIGDDWPESDIALFQEATPYFINQAPFHVNFLTVSGHMMYRFNGNDMADKNHDLVASLSLSDSAKAYLAGQIELDRGLAYLIDQLTKHDLMDQTLIILAADHYPYALSHQDLEALAGKKLDRAKDIYQSSLLMYATGINGTRVSKPVSNVDIVPTIYNLLGFDYDSRLFMGSDMFSDSPGMVVFQDRSFLIEQGFYNAVSHRFTTTGSSIDPIELRAYRQEVDRRFYYSEELIRHDYWRYLEEN